MESVQECLEEILDKGFPELKKKGIQLVEEKRLSPLIGKGMMTIITGKSIEITYAPDIASCPPEAIKGLLAHELAHVYQVTSWKWRILDVIFYPFLRLVPAFNERYHRKATSLDRHYLGFYTQVCMGRDPRMVRYEIWRERNADLIAIQRGYCEYLRTTDAVL
ncbi:MAG: hypothetical protein ABIJ21_07010 [Nanoarchaeota archaeon]